MKSFLNSLFLKQQASRGLARPPGEFAFVASHMLAEILHAAVSVLSPRAPSQQVDVQIPSQQVAGQLKGPLGIGETAGSCRPSWHPVLNSTRWQRRIKEAAWTQS